MENEAYPSPFAASFSSTEEGGKVETWLISPELDVPSMRRFHRVPLLDLRRRQHRLQNDCTDISIRFVDR